MKPQFLDRIVKGESENDCWRWIGSVQSSGYPVFGNCIHAHRYSLEQHLGRPLDCECVRHLCHNKLCCNPLHLVEGTEQQNQWDRYDNPRHSGKFGSHSQYKLTYSEKLEIQRRYVKRQPGNPGNSAELASEFGVTSRQIRNVVKSSLGRK